MATTTGTIVAPPVDSFAATNPANLRPAFALGTTNHSGLFHAHNSTQFYGRNASTGAFASKGSARSNGIRQAWILPDGETVLWIEASTPEALWRGTYDGTTFTPEGSAVQVLSTNGTVLGQYNLRAHGGTLILGEYATSGSAANGIQIWRSTDNGQTWASVHTQASGHCHAIAYHAGLGLWVASFGDTTVNAVLTSDDDGETWATLAQHSVGSNYCQPVGLLDVGDATRLLCGSDNQWQLFWLDLQTGEVDSIISWLPPVISQSHFFDLFRYGGVTYACQNNSQGESHIWVSRDHVNWASWLRTPSGVQRAGIAGIDTAGKLLIEARDTAGTTLTLATPAPLTTRRIKAVEGETRDPSSTNLFTADQSECNAATGWSGSQTPTLVAGGGVDGGNALRYLRAQGGGTGVLNGTTPTVAASASTVYYGRVRVKVIGPVKLFLMRWRTFNGSTFTNLPVGGYFPAVSHDEFFEVDLPPITTAEDVEALGFFFQAQGNDDSEAMGYLVDRIQIVQDDHSPRWAEGGSERASDETSESVAVGSGKTFINCIRTAEISTNYAADRLIARYQVDGSNYVELIYDVSETSLSLVPTIAGEAQTAISIDIEHFHREALLWYAVRVYDDGGSETWALSAANGQPWTHATPAAHNVGAIDATITVAYDEDTTDAMPYDLMAERVTGYLSDDAVEAVAESMAAASPLSTGIGRFIPRGRMRRSWRFTSSR